MVLSGFLYTYPYLFSGSLHQNMSSLGPSAAIKKMIPIGAYQMIKVTIFKIASLKPYVKSSRVQKIKNVFSLPQTTALQCASAPDQSPWSMQSRKQLRRIARPGYSHVARYNLKFFVILENFEHHNKIISTTSWDLKQIGALQ